MCYGKMGCTADYVLPEQEPGLRENQVTHGKSAPTSAMLIIEDKHGLDLPPHA